ncbi:MAG: ribonuclease III [Chromatiaceae bacterium]|nr:ribonuclease III [Gammaproteobacteria bacterium]MCP5299597.1 ribonuclease III [Chromatiaceae bacterium]MCP5307138.1 ribonuclease III [Chromatiaceae bacterium]
MRRLQRRIGYEFHDQDLLERALTHRSLGGRNNERLEFLGDAILGFEVADSLFRSVDDANEGQLSRMRAHLVKRETLAGIARELDLGDILRLGPGELRSGGQTRDSILADAMEAIIAAVYIDGGLDQARELIRRLLGERLAQPSAETERKDPKTRLQEHLQAIGRALPQYEVLEVAGDQHEQTFTVSCAIGLGPDTQGIGPSRRKAEQAAARAMLAQIEAVPQ